MITVQEVEHLAELARIELNEAEKTSLTNDIDSILAYVTSLKEATVSVDITPTAGALHNVTRDDDVHSVSGEDRERLLTSAPYREGEFVAVKKIIEQD